MTDSRVVDRRHMLGVTAAAARVPLAFVPAEDDRPALAAVLVRFRRAYETLDMPAMERLLAENIEFSDPTFHHKASGLAAMRKLMAETAPLFESFGISVEHELIAPPWAIVRQEHVAVLKAHPRSTLRVRGVSLFRIENGRIHEWHDYYDAMGYERQLREAAKPALGGAR
jgi:limonene-1,2-epoxide hydrolase